MNENKLNLEVRHVEASKLVKLSSIIDKAKAWDTLLEALSRPIPRHFVGFVQPLKISLDGIELIKQQFYCGRSPTLALLNHWSITGRRRPTIRTLLYYLHACNLKWAEDYVKQAILDLQPILQVTQPLPEAIESGNQVSTDHNAARDTHIIDPEFRFDDLYEIIVSIEGTIRRYSFNSIFESSNRFCHRPYEPQTGLGTRIGDGRFSSVFRAKTFLESTSLNNDCHQHIVAAKLLKSECNRKYLANEINLAQKINHTNILELLGISLGYEHNSDDPKYICLIYPYMESGSLLNCIHHGIQTRDHQPLKWSERVNIAVKIARGIAYLHNFTDGPIIHRDIKTANILIDLDLEPKVGDFTLVRQLDSLLPNETQISQNIIGTSVYMPPEAFRGDISTKFDTFSFGIVILELITGLKPFNEDLDEDLFTYMSEKLSDIDDKITKEIDGSSDDNLSELMIEKARDEFLVDALDKRAGVWDFQVAKTLFKLALQATESRKKNRPELSDLLPILETIHGTS